MKNLKMLILFAAIIVAISACNTENPITSDKEVNDNSSMISNTWNPSATGDCDYYRRDVEGGGPNGYDQVLTDRSIFGTVIFCSFPGDLYCPLEVMQTGGQNNGIPTTAMLDATRHAYHQIVTGNLTGMVVFPSTGLTVRWTSTSPDTATAHSEVKVWESNGTEPN